MGFLLFLMGYDYFFDKWEVCLVKKIIFCWMKSYVRLKIINDFKFKLNSIICINLDIISGVI